MNLPRSLRNRLIRFVALGGSAAVVNVLLMKVFVVGFGWDSYATRNLANVLSVELSLLYSYVVYCIFVWDDVLQREQKSTVSRLIRYHGSAGTAVVTRWLLLFPLLDAAGVNYVWNTILGATLGCVLNFAIANRYVFAEV